MGTIGSVGRAGRGKVKLIAGVSADLATKVKAGELVNFVAWQIGGKGGGRAGMAGRRNPARYLPAAQESVARWVKQSL